MDVSFNDERGVLVTGLLPARVTAIKAELTVSPLVQGNYGFMPPKFRLYRMHEGKLLVPRYYALDNLDVKYKPKTAIKARKNKRVKIAFAGKLREPQVPIAETMYKSIKKNGGGVLCVPPGTGKTVLALHLACQLRRKTLIIVNNSHLMQQWEKRIAEFVPGATVGYCRGKIVDIDGHDFVIAMLQSLSMKEYDPGTFSVFGTAIVDECHHIAARVFSRALFKLAGTPYLMGLSATPDRDDGLSKVFRWFLGPIVVRQVVSRPGTVQVKMVRLVSTDPKYAPILNRRGQANVMGMISALTEVEARTRWIAAHVNQFVQEGRQVLVLTHRRDHATELHGLVEGSGLIMGQIKPADVEKALTKQCIVGTYSSVSEGFDCSRLDTLVMCTSKKNIEQTVGRILRKDLQTKPRLILDIEDGVGVFESQGAFRRRFYRKQTDPDYTIERFCVNLDAYTEGLTWGEPWNSRKHAKSAREAKVEALMKQGCLF